MWKYLADDSDESYHSSFGKHKLLFNVEKYNQIDDGNRGAHICSSIGCTAPPLQWKPQERPRKERDSYDLATIPSPDPFSEHHKVNSYVQ